MSTSGPNSHAIPSSDATTGRRGRLPRTAVPSRYQLHLRPTVEDGSFSGTVAISLSVPEATHEFVLHALNLSVSEASLTSAGQAGQRAATAILANAVDQTVTVRFAEAIAPGDHELTLVFAGQMETVPVGLHLQRYQEGGQNKTMIATQFEPADARRMFPLWDEPAYRAVFEFTADVPVAFDTMSNMPIAREERLDDRTKRVQFEPTPSMPSYLLVFCAGELAALSQRIAGVDVRILTTPSKQSSARYALSIMEQLLPWFNEYFGVPFALPKLDLISIPGGFEGAMENWGGITFNESALLFDPQTSSQSTKEQIFNIVAHEVAHQWFGNLVTMAWWDDLWLNEGFASWMATKATDHFNPTWRIWPRANANKNHAMANDALRTTHPIHQPVELPSEAVSRFDEISYLKGEAVIRMIEAYLGEDVFRDGIRRYMKAHAYGNSTTDDLWAALEEASGQQVRAIAKSWILQPGFPLVTARRDGNELVVAQERFTFNYPDAEPLTWRVPLVYEAGDKTSFALLEGGEVRLPLSDPGARLKLNWGDVGYFHVWHQGELGERLQRHLLDLPEADRVALLADAWALAQEGRAPLSDYLELVQAARLDDSVAVWEQILDAFDLLDLLLLGAPFRDAFHVATREVLRPIGDRLGWDDRPGELDVLRLLRTRVLATLGRYGDAAVLAEARRRFEAFQIDPLGLPGNLRPVVFGLVGRFANPQQYEALHQLGLGAERIEDRTLFYAAMAKARDAELASRTLAITLTSEVEPTLASRLVIYVRSAEHRDLAVAFARENLEGLLAKCDTLMKNRFLGILYEAYSDDAKADELEAIARKVLPDVAWPEVAKAADHIRFQASVKARLIGALERWAASQAAAR